MNKLYWHYIIPGLVLTLGLSAIAETSDEALLQPERITALQQKLEKTQALLDGPMAWQYERWVYLQNTSAASGETKNLLELLQTTDALLQETRPQVAKLYRYLDEYTGDNWQQRFGQTGLYHQIRRWQKQVKLQDIQNYYYQAALFLSASSDQDTPMDDTFSRLTQSLDDLKPLVESTSPPLAIPAQLWQVRILGLLARQDKKHLQEAQSILDPLYKSPLAVPEQWAYRLESLRLALITPEASADSVIMIKNLRTWLDAQEILAQNKNNYFILLAMLQGQTQKDRTGPLQELYRQYPQTGSKALELIAIQLADKMTGPTPYARLESCSQEELTALGHYLQQSSRVESALAVYDLLIIKEKQQGRSLLPLVWFRAGLGHAQLADQAKESPAFAKQALAAMNLWGELRLQAPQWSQGPSGHQESTEKSVALAAHLAYRLGRENPAQYGPQALETIAGLVGTLSVDLGRPQGLWAQTPPAEAFRYFYGLLLEQAQHYEQAAAWFGQVPAADSNAAQARYHAIYCQRKHALLQPGETLKQNQAWIDGLQKILPAPEAPPDTREVAAPAILLLAELYLDSTPPQTSPCLELLQRYQAWWTPSATAPTSNVHLEAVRLQCQAQVLDKHPLAALNLLRASLHQRLDLPLVPLALETLGGQDKSLWEDIATDNTTAIMGYAQEALPLTEELYRHQKDIPEAFRPAVLRYHAELLSLIALYAARTGDPSAATCCQPAREVLNSLQTDGDYPQQFWYVRCQAMLAYAVGQYQAAQELWYQLRQSGKKDDPDLGRYWWEARCMGLRCLLAQGNTDDARHAIEILRNSGERPPAGWAEQIKSLYQISLGKAPADPNNLPAPPTPKPLS